MTQDDLRMPGRSLARLAWLPAAAAAGLSLVLYAVTLGGTYIYDDRWIILEDPRVTEPSQWRLFWTQQYMSEAPDNLYRPLVSMSYAAQWRLHGDRPWAFHAVNWLLAAGTAAAVAEFTRRLGSLSAQPQATSIATSDNPSPVPAPAGQSGWVGWVAALAAGLLFAAHPAHVEAVAGIVGRAELACTLATFAGLCLFLRRPLSRTRVVGILACFIAALLSKEQGLLFPLLMAILAWVRRARSAASSTASSTESSGSSHSSHSSRSSKVDRARGRWLAVCLIWLESAYLFFREHILRFEWPRSWLSWADNPMVRSVGADRWLMPLVLLGRYAVLAVAPYRLSLDYGASVIGSSVRYREPYLYLGGVTALLWLACFVACLLRWRRAARRKTRSADSAAPGDPGMAPAAVFALLGAALTLGMVGNGVTLIGTIFGERLLFMPSAFLAILAGLLMAHFIPERRAAGRGTGDAPVAPPGRRVAAGAVLVILLTWVVLGSVRTVTYARQWNSRLAFYQAGVAGQPKSVRLHALLYHEYALAGDWPAARRVGEECRREVPEWWESWVMCIEPDIEMGRLREADALVNRAAEVCYNDALYGWWERVQIRLAQAREVGAVGPARTTRPSSP